MMTRLIFVAAIGGAPFEAGRRRSLVAAECRPGLGRLRPAGRILRSFVAGPARRRRAGGPSGRGLGLGRRSLGPRFGWSRRARRELDDAKARHAVGDAQRVLEALQQISRTVELQQVVVRLALVADLVGQRAKAPVVLADDLARLSDQRARVAEDLLPALVLDRGVEQEHEVVRRGGLGHERGVRGAGANRAPGATSGGVAPSRGSILRRIRWGNLARLLVVPALIAVVLMWPRLSSPPPSLPGDPALGPDLPAGPTPAGDADATPPRGHRHRQDRAERSGRARAPRRRPRSAARRHPRRRGPPRTRPLGGHRQARPPRAGTTGGGRRERGSQRRRPERAAWRRPDTRGATRSQRVRAAPGSSRRSAPHALPAPRIGPAPAARPAPAMRPAPAAQPAPALRPPPAP